MRVMPDVHLRRVKNVLQRTHRDVDVGVIEMSNQRSENVQCEEVSCTESKERERHIQHGVVYHVLHPVISHVRSKSHLLDADGVCETPTSAVMRATIDARST